MLPKANRLVKEHDFTLVFKKGQHFQSQFLGLRFLLNQLPCSRFGFVISNKISKKATVRNKIKRRLREVIRLNLDQLKSGYDVVVVVSPKAVDLDFQELKTEAEGIFRKMRLMN